MQKYALSSHIVWQIERKTKKVYVIDKKNDVTYLFAKVSKDIWRMLCFNLAVDSMAEIIASRYKIEKEKALMDVRKFIESIKKEGIIYEII